MASAPDSVSMALFCDFENVALGVRDAKYEKFDIKRVLERLLLKGSIVVKKAYCDWERYKSFKAAMHEANFELIEIPHVRQSGKNSADIRLVVDALDLCYTKSHVDTFVIISGDSDFSPLVSKLRENAKQVIGVGVKQSTSDLLIANCDEFIFYDDLVRDSQRVAAKREARDNPPAGKRSPDEDRVRREELEARRGKAIDIAVETFEALLAERGESGKIWSSMLKEAIKRRKPDFNESYFGFRAFGNLLEEAQTRGLLELGRDEKSGTYVTRPAGGGAIVEVDGADERAAGGRSGAPDGEANPATHEPAAAVPLENPAADHGADETGVRPPRAKRGARGGGTQKPPPAAETGQPPPGGAVGAGQQPAAEAAPESAQGAESSGRRGRGRGRGTEPADVPAAPPEALPAVAGEAPRRGRRGGARAAGKSANPVVEEAAQAQASGADPHTAPPSNAVGDAAVNAAEPAVAVPVERDAESAKDARPPATRARRVRKPKAEGSA